MEQSRRAVESYWRSKMIDAATSDEDKVTPVYKLEEICDLIRCSHVSIVKEVSEFIIKRLEHKSPVVKQKALRVVKYALGKSGAEFKREMQRNSVAIRQLIHYKGQPDPLKGEALNKAVRETAKEALSVLFSSDDSTVAPAESSLRDRIQGFGNTNYDVPFEDKRSLISEVVDFGSATIKQGLSSLTHSSSLQKNGDGRGYKSPYLQRSLTKESDFSHQYEGFNSEHRLDAHDASRFTENAGSTRSGPNITTSHSETSGNNSSLVSEHKTREEKLLETIVKSAGVRLQPTRDALNAFMMEASKLNPSSLSYAIESKLQSPLWQIRMRALCVLDAVLRKKDERHFSTIASYFSKNKDSVLQCLESPQASLRDKAVKVLNILEGGYLGDANQVDKANSRPTVPDLIDTGDTDESESLKATEVGAMKNEGSFTAPLIDDLLDDHFESTSVNKIEDDPFSDVSFLTSQDKGFSGGIDAHKLGSSEAFASLGQVSSEPFGISNMGNEDVFNAKTNHMTEAAFLIDGLSISGNDPTVKSGKAHINSVISAYDEGQVPSSNVFNYGFASQAAGMNANSVYPLGTMHSNFPSGMIFDPMLGSQHVNYGALGTLHSQQQFLATMANFHQIGNLQSDASSSGIGTKGGNSSPLPDIFNPGMAIQPPTSLSNGSKRDETKAFDFISDHLTSARDTKRVI